MDPNFWHQKWEKNEIGFHEPDGNAQLVKHFQALSLAQGSRVFVPLCGKTRDVAWLLSQGYAVAGAELSETAIEQLFVALGVEPHISNVGELKLFSAEAIDIFVGDIFALSGDLLGAVDAIYDRAALVALPEPMRSRYVAHLMAITGQAPQLLVSFEYDQAVMPGPPFSVSNEAINHYYSDHYTLTLAASEDVPGGLKGKCAALENVWLLETN